MFEEVPIILGFMLFSIVVSYILMKYAPQPLFKVIKALAVVGIIIHEICHVLMCFITRSPMKKVSLLKRMEIENDSTKFGFYGQVQVYEDKVSFLQAFLVSFAPLFLSFWLFFSILGLLINGYVVDPLIFALCIFLLVSLTLSAVPSIADLVIIPRAFSYDSGHSLYQILLVILAILSTWLITFNQYFHEIFIYLIITGFYFVFKFGFRITRNVVYSIYTKRTNRIVNPIIQNKGILYRRRKLWKR